MTYRITKAAICALLPLCAIAFSTPSHAKSFKPSLDVDQDGMLSIDEFVMAMGDREFGRRDDNRDGVMSRSEWLGGGGNFQILTLEKFNADKDDKMSAEELVEVFTWVFDQRDNDGDRLLSPSEAPKFLTED